MEELEKVLSCESSCAVIDGDPRKSQNVVTLGWNTCYIVCGLVIKDGKVLMVQEAKPSCRGKWYLPAGRMERGESIEDAVRREVKEEAGVDFEPKALVILEFQTTNWIRFTFVGEITGGELKTPAQADKESIQAQWLPADVEKLAKDFPIRAYDCLHLIELTKKWYAEEEASRYKQLTVPMSHNNSSIRIVLIYMEGDNLSILVRDTRQGNTIFPCRPFGQYPALNHEITAAVRDSGHQGDFKIVGMLSLEHNFSEGDGLGMSLLLKATETSLRDGCGYHWEKVTKPNIVEKFKTFLSHEYSVVQLVDLL